MSNLEIIRQFHERAMPSVFVMTGGGASVAAQLLAVPGASKSVAEVVVPYATEAFDRFLGRIPDSYCSRGAARALAERARSRASELRRNEPTLGVAVTAALATDRPKKGDHRFFLAIDSETASHCRELTLEKGAHDRAGEEAILAGTLLNFLAEVLGLTARVAVDYTPAEQLMSETFPHSGAVECFLRGETAWVVQEVDGRCRTAEEAEKPAALVCGSFNPLHAGHRRLREVASAMVPGRVGYEISIANVDKPDLPAATIRQRLPQFVWHAPLYLTRGAKFRQKADWFPGTTFVVGADTAARMLDAKYADNDPAKMADDLRHLQTRGCRVLVAGRVDGSGAFLGLDDLAVPPEFAELFVGIPEARFRVDVSSSQLRRSATS